MCNITSSMFLMTHILDALTQCLSTLAVQHFKPADVLYLTPREGVKIFMGETQALCFHTSFIGHSDDQPRDSSHSS